ncbi:hypothetical protein DRQ36_02520 [bacterium]|nr:MAG: hypothetical protein DRQ36_02520 [bacterium]
MIKPISIITAFFIIVSAAIGEDIRESIPPPALRLFTQGLLSELEGEPYRAMLCYRAVQDYIPDDPEIIRSIADLYIKTGKPEEALEEYERAIKIDPDNEYYRRGAAEAASQMGDYDKAVDQFRWIIENGSPDFTVRFQYSFALINIGKLKKALKELRRLIEDYPEEPAPWSLLGDIYMTRSEFDLAIESFSSAIALDSSYAQAYLGLAAAYEASDMPDSSIEAYGRFVILKPDDSRVLRRWVDQLIFREEYSRALDAAEVYLDRNPDDWDLLRRVAFLAFFEEDYDASSDYFERVLEWDPSDREARLFYSRSLLMTDRIEESIRQIEIVLAQKRDPEGIVTYALALEAADTIELALKILQQGETEFPGSADIPLYRGIIISRAKDYDAAKSAFYRALDIEPYNLEALFGLGDALERSGERDSAIIVFKDIIAEDPKDPLSANYLGYILVETDRELELADSLISLAIGAEPDNPAYIDSYGWLLYKRGELDEALQWLQRAEELADPPDPVIFEHIAVIHEKSGDIELAIEYYEKALALDPTMEKARERLEILKRGR